MFSGHTAHRTDNGNVLTLIPPGLEPLGIVGHDVSNTAVVNSVKCKLQHGGYRDIVFHSPKSDSNGTNCVWLEYAYFQCYWM